MDFDLDSLQKGTPLKRKGWGGYWKWEDDTIMMYCKDGRVINIRDNEDMDFTIRNILADDWEIAVNSNCTISVK